MSRDWVKQLNEMAEREGPYDVYKKFEPGNDMGWAEMVARCFNVYLEPGTQQDLPADHEAHMRSIPKLSIAYYAGVMAAGAFQRWLIERDYNAVEKRARMPMNVNKRVPSYQAEFGSYQLTCGILIDDDDDPYVHIELQENHWLDQYWFLALNPHPTYGMKKQNILTHIDPGFNNPNKFYQVNEIVPPGPLPDREPWSEFHDREWNIKWAKNTAHWIHTSLINTVVHVENKLRTRRRSRGVDI